MGLELNVSACPSPSRYSDSPTVAARTRIGRFNWVTFEVGDFHSTRNLISVIHRTDRISATFDDYKPRDDKAPFFRCRDILTRQRMIYLLEKLAKMKTPTSDPPLPGGSNIIVVRIKTHLRRPRNSKNKSKIANPIMQDCTAL